MTMENEEGFYVGVHQYVVFSILRKYAHMGITEVPDSILIAEMQVCLGEELEVPDSYAGKTSKMTVEAAQLYNLARSTFH